MTDRVFARQGGVVKAITNAFARHNGVVKPVQEIWCRRPNGQVQKIWPLAAVSGAPFDVYESNFNAPIVVTISLNTNGTSGLSVTADGSSVTPNSSVPSWFNPTTTGIGNNYWVRWVEGSVFGAGATVGGNLGASPGAFLPLSVVRTLSLTTGAQLGFRQVTGTFTFATSSAGANPVEVPVTIAAEVLG